MIIFEKFATNAKNAKTKKAKNDMGIEPRSSIVSRLLYP